MPKLDTVFTKQRDLSKKRMEICKQCEHLATVTNICRKCGCFIPAKTMFSYVECPIGKWKKEIL